MGCSPSKRALSQELRQEARSLRVMRAVLPAAFMEAYQVTDCDTYDAVGGMLRVISREDGAERTARVYRVRDSNDEESVSMAQFSMEEYVASLLTTERVAALFESYLDTRRKPYMGVLILERARGGRLLDRLQTRAARMREEDARHIAAQLAEVLEAFSRIGATCGNLTLDNIYYRDDFAEDILLQNIPYASLKGQEPTFTIEYEEYEADDGREGTVTRRYPLGGRDLRYSAPEVLMPNEKRNDLKSPADCWAFGVIVYTLLAGYMPFDEPEKADIAEKIRVGNYTAFSYDTETWKNISLAAKDLIAGCLRVDPAKRFNVKRIINHPWITKATFIPGSDRGTSQWSESVVGDSENEGSADVVLATVNEDGIAKEK